MSKVSNLQHALAIAELAEREGISDDQHAFAYISRTRSLGYQLIDWWPVDIDGPKEARKMAEEARDRLTPDLRNVTSWVVELNAPEPAAPAEYLERFPPDHRVSCDRAYQDGLADGLADVPEPFKDPKALAIVAAMASQRIDKDPHTRAVARAAGCTFDDVLNFIRAVADTERNTAR